MEMPLGFGHNVQAEDGASQLSSSSISSPPNSPPQNHGASDTIRVAHPPYPTPGFPGDGVAAATPAQTAAAPNAGTKSTNSNATTQPNSGTNGTAPEKPKRQRKKKDVGPDGKPVVEEKPKEKKPRKPREPKDKTAPAPGDKPTTSRKKVKTEEKPAQDVPTQPRQPTITEMVASFTQPSQPAAITIPTPPQQLPSNSMFRPSVTSLTSNSPTPRPYSSGQNYDPIRGSTVEPQQPRSANASNGPASAQASPHANRASASPAIASLIDPPTAIKATAPPPSYSPQTSLGQPFFVPSQHSPPPVKPTSAFAQPPQPQPSPPVKQPASVTTGMDGAMDVDATCEIPKPQIPEIKAPSKSSSSAPTPKAARPTPPPPKGTGSGLLSSSDLFGGPSASEVPERKGPNIVLHIPLNPRGENNINLAQEIVKKYGRDAINPRAAAHREQLLRIQAEQNRLNDSNDDMSVDLLSEMDGDSNVEMGGMEDEKSNTGLETDGKPVRKRRRKVEEYDKEDDFIDDTELAWQEQAAVAKDGFFVYSGPLVPPGQEAQVESATTTRGRGGRGRGRGGRTATSGTTHASLAEKSRDPTTSTRSRARGTRGTGAPRKPRITKADRERMEAEKNDRERAAAGMGGLQANATTNASAAPAPAPAPAPTHAMVPPMPSQPQMPPPMPQQQPYANSHSSLIT